MLMFLVDRLPKEHSGSADQSLGNDSYISVLPYVNFSLDYNYANIVEAWLLN